MEYRVLNKILMIATVLNKKETNYNILSKQITFQALRSNIYQLKYHKYFKWYLTKRVFHHFIFFNQLNQHYWPFTSISNHTIIPTNRKKLLLDWRSLKSKMANTNKWSCKGVWRQWGMRKSASPLFTVKAGVVKAYLTTTCWVNLQ